MLRYAACLLVVFASILGTSDILIRTGQKDPDWNFYLTRKKKAVVMLFALVQAADIARRLKGYPLWEQCLWGIFAACLLTACIMDLWEHMVYCFVWWIGGAAAGGFLFWRAKGVSGIKTVLLSLFLYFILQHMFFGHLYGRADCHAFCVCAVAFTALGMGFRDYVIHMALTFGGLAVTQALCANIARNGNLKKPVPLIPYITAAFWLWVDFTV